MKKKLAGTNQRGQNGEEADSKGSGDDRTRCKKETRAQISRFIPGYEGKKFSVEPMVLNCGCGCVTLRQNAKKCSRCDLLWYQIVVARWSAIAILRLRAHHFFLSHFLSTLFSPTIQTGENAIFYLIFSPQISFPLVFFSSK